ncbi:nitrite reductase small subunit NirD [Agaribacter flavus]|uniref:Nitrite reductase small subunit NirD n=1 Tax=Agaribacter flavus TaxID=1902781 RepID=A0ABV7FKP0_9ALTE
MSIEWHNVCGTDDLVTNSGVCALLNGQQVAIFKVGKTATDGIFAVDNFDPIGKAQVLYRGIIGSIGDKTVVASPLYKQHFDLSSGECLEAPEHKLKVWPVRVEGNSVQLGTGA